MGNCICFGKRERAMKVKGTSALPADRVGLLLGAARPGSHQPGETGDGLTSGNAVCPSGDFPMAVSIYTEALRLDPISHIALSNRSAALVKMGRFADALQDAVRARQLKINWPKTYYRQGVALQFLGCHGDALAAFSTGLVLNPKSALFLAGLVETSMKSPLRATLGPAFAQLEAMDLGKSPFDLTVARSVGDTHAAATALASLGSSRIAQELGSCAKNPLACADMGHVTPCYADYMQTKRQIAEAECIHLATHITWKQSAVVLSPGEIFHQQPKRNFSSSEAGRNNNKPGRQRPAGWRRRQRVEEPFPSTAISRNPVRQSADAAASVSPRVGRGVHQLRTGPGRAGRPHGLQGGVQGACGRPVLRGGGADVGQVESQAPRPASASSAGDWEGNGHNTVVRRPRTQALLNHPLPPLPQPRTAPPSPHLGRNPVVYNTIKYKTAGFESHYGPPPKVAFAPRCKVAQVPSPQTPALDRLSFRTELPSNRASSRKLPGYTDAGATGSRVAAGDQSAAGSRDAGRLGIAWGTDCDSTA